MTKRRSSRVPFPKADDKAAHTLRVSWDAMKLLNLLREEMTKRAFLHSLHKEGDGFTGSYTNGQIVRLCLEDFCRRYGLDLLPPPKEGVIA